MATKAAATKPEINKALFVESIKNKEAEGINVPLLIGDTDNILFGNTWALSP